jgi:spore coat polysaccharide biosynthesis protein SpsF
MRVGAFIQARMSSSRFPGKVLAPLNGRPIILYSVERARAALNRDDVFVLTSDAESDDPLANYLEHMGIPVVRGPLDDVFDRFRRGLARANFDWFFRISADSPLLRPDLMTSMQRQVGSPNIDLVSNVVRRTFPRGHSMELIRSKTFLALDDTELSGSDREHVTPVFYRFPDRYGIVSFEMAGTGYGGSGYAVDTIDDLKRLEELVRAGGDSSFPPYEILNPRTEGAS